MLDNKDKIIFEHLLHNCRTPLKYLAKVTNLSKPTVLYRINKLEKNGYIEKYDAILNHNKIFPKTQFILLKVKKSKEQEVEKTLLKNPEIASIFKLIDKYNYFLLANIQDLKSFKSHLNKISLSYKIHSLKEINFYPFSIFDVPIKYSPKSTKKKIKTTKPLKLDKTDIKIIKTLSNGGARFSILELARKTNLSAEKVLYRFRRFQKENLFPWFVAQPGIEKFSINNDIVKLKIKNNSQKQILEKMKTIKKSGWLAKISPQVYLTQIFTQSLEEYKNTLEKIWNTLSEDLVDLKTYNTKNWIILNRHNFESLRKQHANP